MTTVAHDTNISNNTVPSLTKELSISNLQKLFALRAFEFHVTTKSPSLINAILEKLSSD